MNTTSERPISNKLRKPKRTPSQKNADRARIAKLHLAGWSNSDIAEELNRVNSYTLEPSTVWRDIQVCEELWREACIQSIDRKKAIQAERLMKMMREAWDSWEKSKAPQQERTTSAVPNQNGSGQALKETKVTTRETPGDVAYLHVVMHCIQEYNKIFGLYAPVRSEFGGIQGGVPISLTAPDFGGIDPDHAHKVLEDEFRFKFGIPSDAQPIKLIAEAQPKTQDDEQDETEPGTEHDSSGQHSQPSGGRENSEPLPGQEHGGDVL